MSQNEPKINPATGYVHYEEPDAKPLPVGNTGIPDNHETSGEDELEDAHLWDAEPEAVEDAE